MTEQTEYTTPEAGAVPARIALEDFIEAVTRGVARALAAQDDVSGYLAHGGLAVQGSPTAPGGGSVRPSIVLAGIFAPPPWRSPPNEVVGGTTGTTVGG
jgi:hypothetical protein